MVLHNLDLHIVRSLNEGRRLADGQEFQISAAELIAYGSTLFQAAWTSQEGGGRPLTKGTGGPFNARGASARKIATLTKRNP